MPRMRGRLYSSCASSTWSFPSADVACWAKMSRISCVRSIDARVERVLEEPLLGRIELVVDEQALRVGVGEPLLQLLELALADVGALRRPRAVLDDGADRLDAGRPGELADLGELLLRVDPLAQHGENEAALGLRGTWDHRQSSMALADRTLDLVNIPSESRSEAALYDYVRAAVPLEPAFDDGESVLFAKRSGKPLVLLAGHTDTVPAQGNLPGRIEDGAVVGLGASDMKGGLAVMIELARWAHDADTAYDVAFLFFPREELGPAENPLPGVFERTGARRRGAARDLPRADRQHAPARLPRQPERARRVRGPVGALGAAVARHERDRASPSRGSGRCWRASRATSTSTGSCSAR